jgi:outer membrane lipoprotein-sorting protein
MKKITILLLIGFFYLSPEVYSQAYKPLKDNTTFVTRLKSKSKEVKSISASFKETIYSSMILEPNKNNGQFLYEASSKIRWEKFKPAEVILFDGNDLKRYKDGELVDNQGSKRITKRIIDLILILVDGSFYESKDFDISYFENDSSYRLLLKPTSTAMSKAVETIELVFLKTDISLKEFTILESELDYIQYEFSNLEYNKSIDPIKFKSL